MIENLTFYLLESMHTDLLIFIAYFSSALSSDKFYFVFLYSSIKLNNILDLSTSEYFFGLNGLVLTYMRFSYEDSEIVSENERVRGEFYGETSGDESKILTSYSMKN